MTQPGASYARISDYDGAGPGVGVADQHRRNRKRADADDIDVIAELTDDDRSAFKKNVIRDDYLDLLDYIRDGRLRYVLVKHADRLHRQPAEAEAFIGLAQQHNVVVVTASGLRYHLDTADGRRAFRDAANAASYESEHKAERVSESHERRAMAGEYRGGLHRPFGWGVPTGVVRRARDKKTGRPRNVEILDMTRHDPAEAAEVRRWANELLADTSMRQVIRAIKLPSITGTAWSSRVVKQILTAPRVAGHSVYRGEIVKWNAWPEIIPEDTRQALITLFADPARRTAPGNTPRWLGSKVYLCGVCEHDREQTDRSRYVMTVSGRTTEGVPTYRCTGRTSHCARRTDWVDEYVEDALVTRLAREDIADLIPQPKGAVDVAALREQITVLKQRKVRAGLVFADDDDAEALAAAKAEIDGQIAVIKQQLATESEVSPLADFVGVDTVEDARAVWEGCSLGRQRQILRTLATVVLSPMRRNAQRDSVGLDESSVQVYWTPFADSLASNGTVLTS